MVNLQRRPPMPAAVQATIEQLLSDNSTGEARSAVWTRLEDAHVLSQPWVWPHLRVHFAMFSLAWKDRDPREIAGQLIRLALAAPGSALGRYPTGNTGRSNVSAFEQMPIRHDLAQLLNTNDGDKNDDNSEARSARP